MRRRTLLGGDSTNYVFSASTTSVSASYTSSAAYVNIKSTLNGTNIGYSVVSYDGTVVTSVTTAATSVTIKYSANTTASQRSGKVVLKQSESGKIITITIKQAGASLEKLHHVIVLDAANSSTGYTTFCEVTESGTVTSKPSWANVTCSNGRISVTATSANSATSIRSGTTTITVGTQSTSLSIIQLPSSYSSVDGHEYVTINSLKWAIKNVGASSITSLGNKYQWGAGSTTYVSGQSQYHTGGTDTSYTLPSSADTATQVMGGGWRMPTYEEVNTLTYGSRTSYRASYNGATVWGIYDPSSGGLLIIPTYKEDNYYISRNWSSSPYNSNEAYYGYGYGTISCFYDGGYTTASNTKRNSPLYVRGVHD